MSVQDSAEVLWARRAECFHVLRQAWREDEVQSSAWHSVNPSELLWELFPSEV